MRRPHAPPPPLSQTYSGIPERLSKEAQDSKDRIYSNKTLPASVPRRFPVRLPPNTTLPAFDAAIVALKQELGEKNVILNDQPLVDGWYLEHPNTHDAFHIIEQEELVSSAVAYPAS